jgi:hypothetical protein
MPIPKTATKYTIDSDNRLYRDGKRLRVRRTDNGVFGQVVCDDGIRRRVNLEKLADPDRDLMTTEYIFGKEGAKAHPEYTDYAVTDYGDVYCLRNSKSGIHANRIYIVPDFLHGPSGKRYISIRRPNGTRYQIRLARFVRQVWGDDTRFNEDE